MYLKKLPDQTISYGEFFDTVNLNNLILPAVNNLKTVWQVKGNNNINVIIDSTENAHFIIRNMQWRGSDTVIFTALINNSTTLHTQTILTVTSPPFYDMNPVRPLKNILLTGVNDVISLATSPAGWDSTDFIKLPILLIGTYTLMVSDELTHKWISNDGRAKPNPLMDFGTFYGETIVTQLTSLGFAAYGLAFNNNEFLQIGLEIYESYFIANNINSIMKRTFGRARPYEDKGAYVFHPFSGGNNPAKSFPSGHSTLAFSLSSVLAAHAKSTWLKILLYTPAAVTAISRVYNNKHWLSDVFMGSAVGYFVGSYLVERHNNVNQNHYSIGMDGSGRVCLQVAF